MYYVDYCECGKQLLAADDLEELGPGDHTITCECGLTYEITVSEPNDA